MATRNVTYDATTVLNSTNCDPRLIVVDDAMSLTRANITGWNKADIENAFFKEVGLDRVIAQTKEARMAGVSQRTLTDLILSRHAPLSQGKGSVYPSVIQPFRLEPRRNRVNPTYFRVSAGAASAAADYATTLWPSAQGSQSNGNVPDAHWTLTVNNGSLDADSSPWAKSPNNVLKSPEKFFLPGHNITIEWVSAAGVSKTAVMRVVSSKAGLTADQATLVVAPNRTYKGDSNFGMPAVGRVYTDNGWWETTATAGDKAGYQPTVGVVKIQANSVSDYQSYGYALPGFNDYGLLERWRQTMRWVHKYNDQYVAALEASTTSEGLKKFRMLPLAKLRAIQEKLQEDFFFETVFYGDIINEKQTTADWQSLPIVSDPAWAASGESGSLNIEYLSNTIGLRTQIGLCGNVLDKQGGALDVDDLLEQVYLVKREREGETGTSVPDVDIMCDLRWTRPTLRQLFIKYFKAKYAVDSVTSFCEMGKKISYNGSVMWEYDSYDLPDQGCRLNVISDLYFDDRIAAFPAAQKSRGRGIWMLDWSDIAVNLIKTHSVPRTNNLADDLYKYVMTANVQHVLLNSKTFEVAVGNTNRHRMIENFSDACPKLTVQGCDLAAPNA
jgi:hypothetical protein